MLAATKPWTECRCGMNDLFYRDDNIVMMRNRIGRIDTVMNNTEFFLLGDVARILRCQPYQIVYLLSTRQLPEPMRIGNKRVFTIADMQRIADKLQLQLAQELIDGDGNWKSKEDHER